MRNRATNRFSRLASQGWVEVLTLSKTWLTTVLSFLKDCMFGTAISKTEINKQKKIKCICQKVELNMG